MLCPQDQTALRTQLHTQFNANTEIQNYIIDTTEDINKDIKAEHTYMYNIGKHTHTHIYIYITPTHPHKAMYREREGGEGVTVLLLDGEFRAMREDTEVR